MKLKYCLLFPICAMFFIVAIVFLLNVETTKGEERVLLIRNYIYFVTFSALLAFLEIGFIFGILKGNSPKTTMFVTVVSNTLLLCIY